MSISLQAELGDIVYVELPEVGSEVKQGEQFGVIESVKVSQCPCHTVSWTAIRTVCTCFKLHTQHFMQCRLQVMSTRLYLVRSLLSMTALLMTQPRSVQSFQKEASCHMYPCISKSVRKLLHAISSQVMHVLTHLVKCSKVRKQVVRNFMHRLGCLAAQVNKEPFSGGWLMKVKLSDKGELDSLLDASKYEEHCAKSEH